MCLYNIYTKYLLIIAMVNDSINVTNIALVIMLNSSLDLEVVVCNLSGTISILIRAISVEPCDICNRGGANEISLAFFRGYIFLGPFKVLIFFCS